MYIRDSFTGFDLHTCRDRWHRMHLPLVYDDGDGDDNGDDTNDGEDDPGGDRGNANTDDNRFRNSLRMAH